MSSSGPLTCVLLLVATGMAFAPEHVVVKVRATVADGLLPAQLVMRQGFDKVQENVVTATSPKGRSHKQEIQQLKDQLQREQAYTTALQVQLARQADMLAREDSMPQALRQLPNLVSTSLIEANVLGDSASESWRSGKLLNRGEKNGVRETSLVIQSRNPLVDLGRDAQVSPEDALLLGRCVIGKIERVGRWSSTFILLTDSAYRGRAQLIHRTDSGFVFGAKGILKGQGTSLCRLEGIGPADSVSVGDAVYTTDRDSPSSTPLYYGRVSEASLDATDKEWKVLVEPVPVPNDLTTVQILRIAVNTDRLSAGL